LSAPESRPVSARGDICGRYGDPKLPLSSTSEYGRGAAALSVGIASTGVVTYAYFALASHALTSSAYGGIALLWSAVFVVVSVLYRPVEQLLSRTIADREARGSTGREHLRVAATIQCALAALFVAAALALRHPLQHGLLGGAPALYWIMVAAVPSYAASYFARGFLAGHRRFGLYGILVLVESSSRCAFAIVAVIGISHGQTAVALGIAAAPLLSLSVVPWALRRRLRRSRQAEPGVPAAEGELTLARGAGFAGAVLVIMLAEQTFLNAGPLLVKATAAQGAAALAGFAFNVLLIARAPLQLFQAVQTSILPHLTRLRAAGDEDPFRRAVTRTILAVAAFAAIVAVLLLTVGPTLMHAAFGHGRYARGGLVAVAAGMGLYLSAATLNQAALARGRARDAAICWSVAAAAFVVLLVAPRVGGRVLQVELAYLAGAAVLCALLYGLYRRA